MHPILAYFHEEDPHRILIPRGKLCFLWGLLWLLACATLLLFQGLFIMLSLIFGGLFGYVAVYAFRVWRRYYAVAWFFVWLSLILSTAMAVRILMYRVLF